MHICEVLHVLQKIEGVWWNVHVLCARERLRDIDAGIGKCTFQQEPRRATCKTHDAEPSGPSEPAALVYARLCHSEKAIDGWLGHGRHTASHAHDWYTLAVTVAWLSQQLRMAASAAAGHSFGQRTRVSMRRRCSTLTLRNITMQTTSANAPVPQAASTAAEDSSGCVTHTSTTTGRSGRCRRRSTRRVHAGSEAGAVSYRWRCRSARRQRHWGGAGCLGGGGGGGGGQGYSGRCGGRCRA